MSYLSEEHKELQIGIVILHWESSSFTYSPEENANSVASAGSQNYTGSSRTLNTKHYFQFEFQRVGSKKQEYYLRVIGTACSLFSFRWKFYFFCTVQWTSWSNRKLCAIAGMWRQL